MISILNPEISQEILVAISFTILHSLWQISLLALCIKLFCRYRLKDKPIPSYHGNIATILMSMIASIFTFTYYIAKGFAKSSENITEAGTIDKLTDTSVVIITSDTITSNSILWSDWILSYNAYIASFWAIGMTILLCRIIAGWLGIRIIKSQLSFDVPIEVSSSFDNLKSRLKVNSQVTLALSKAVSVPMVLGHIKPIVLLPLASINQLSIEELESIFVHELTHVMQHDYIKNLIVMIGESIFFYHPVIWLLSSEIKEERENICDDAVMKLYPDRLQYAKTLVKLEEVFQPSREGLSLALFTNKFKLMKRVKRIMNINQSSHTGRAKLVVAGLLICSFVVFSSADIISQKAAVDKTGLPIPPAPPAPPAPPVFDIPAPPPAPPAFDAPPAPPAPPTPPAFGAIPEPPAPPVPPSFDEFRISFGMDTLDEPEREELRKKLRQKKSELKEKTRKLQMEMREAREKLKEEYKSDLKERRQELKELRQKLKEEGIESRSFHFDSDEMSDEELEEFTERMEEWGEKFGERIAEQFDDEWVEKMENWGESFGEQFSEELSEEFGEGWAEKFEGLGEEMAEIFDDEWVEGLEEMTEGLAEVFTEDWADEMERMGEEIADIVEEVVEDHEDYDRRVSKSSRAKKQLLGALENDNLIKSGKNKVIITDDEMTVNGTTLSRDLLAKYQRIITQNNTKAFKDGETKVKFTFKGNGYENSSLSISVEN